MPSVSAMWGGGDSVSQIISLLFYGVFIIFLFYGQKIQMYIIIREIEGSLHKLKFIRDEGRKIAIKTIKEIGKPEVDPTDRVNRFLEYFTIAPQSMDPAGIVPKLDHILDVRDDRLKDEVKLMVPTVDEAQTNNLENTLEAAMALNFIYKVVRHFYLLYGVAGLLGCPIHRLLHLAFEPPLPLLLHLTSLIGTTSAGSPLAAATTCAA